MLKNIFLHNWWAILYFNLRMLPLKQAIHLPFDFYGSIRFINLNGKVNLYADKLKIGMIKIGSQGSDMFPKSETVLNISGSLEIKDRLVIGMGSSIISCKDSIISFGRNTIVGANNLIYCEKMVSLGDNFLSSWNCQIMDSDTHEVIDLDTGKSNIMCQNVFVGDNVWFGNGVIVNKGTKFASNTIVASRSLCNKDYTQYGEYCVLAGSPAKVVANNKKWKK